MLILGLALGLSGLNMHSSAHAFQEGAASGKISLLKAGRPIYVPRTTAIFNVEVENDGPAAQDYQLTMVVYSPSGDKVFRSSVQRINQLMPGEKKLFQFQWSTSGRTDAGEYTLTANLRDLVLFDVLFDSISRSDGHTFEVQTKPLVFLSDDAIDFGEFLPGETPEQSLFVYNIGNGVLEWSITSVPDYWIELVSPLGDAKEDATVMLRVKKDAPISRRLEGVLVIQSNGGYREITLSGKIEGIFDGKFENIKTSKGQYRQGETINLQYTAKNTGTVALEYGAAITVVAPDGSIAYDGVSAGKKVRLPLKAEESRMVNFVWDLALDAPVGFYKAYVSLTYWFDPEYIFYDALDEGFMWSSDSELINVLFEVKDGPNLVAEPTEWDYGSILVDQAVDSANIEISNAGAATLEWELISWPDWIDIAKPAKLINVGDNNILARVRPSLPPDNYSGAIGIKSNGGNITIPVSISIALPATQTPVATATVEPTATVLPVLPTETAVPPTVTSTPWPDRVAPPPPTTTARPTVTSTPTPVPPTATATPVPTARPVVAQATVEPTSTPEEEPSGVGCSAPLGNVSLASGLVNGLLMMAPLGLIAGAKYGRRRRK